MVKFVGWFFVILGVLLVCTVFLMWVGFPVIAFGVTILVAASLVDRHARKVAEGQQRIRFETGPSVDPDADRRASEIRGSMFGR
jgi:1,4-dihydroxy-2-naphthoate octaprenyltransferase